MVLDTFVGASASVQRDSNVTEVTAGVPVRIWMGLHRGYDSQRARSWLTTSTNVAAPLREVLSPYRGRRPHHVQKDRIGTWEISSLTHWPCEIMGVHAFIFDPAFFRIDFISSESSLSVDEVVRCCRDRSRTVASTSLFEYRCSKASLRIADFRKGEDSALMASMARLILF
jgi:hypothetical protein